MAQRGDIANLDDPRAQELLRSVIPARLAFVGADGSPRVTPIWFHWEGSELSVSTFASSAKVRAIRRNPRVALTIDTDESPYLGLVIRGTTRITAGEAITSEYAATALRYLGEERGTAWAAMALNWPMAKIVVTPEWVEIIDTSPMLAAAMAR